MKTDDSNRAALDKGEFDLIIIGGGITGAGIFHEAAGLGLNALLLEAKDFAWGTSSRSSKMVHGGLRYLKQGKFLLTRSAVRERERLLKAYPGLITPLNFLMPIYKDCGPSRFSMKLGLSIYSFLAGEKQHQSFTKKQTLEFHPLIRGKYLVSAVGFKDAQVDDARLVLRLINDGCLAGGIALNYTKVIGVERDSQGYVAGVTAVETGTGRERELKTKAVVNATGAWAEYYHPSPDNRCHLRPLRGSHLIFPGNTLPLDRVVGFTHPEDSRNIFISPWKGLNVLGTTDIDHEGSLDRNPVVSEYEAAYLMEGLKFAMPGLDISLKDCISSIAGIRPVLSRKKKSASEESREHVVWADKGLVTVTGGKLTTFRLLALDALKAAGRYLPRNLNGRSPKKETKPAFAPKGVNGIYDFPNNTGPRLVGRYGRMAPLMLVHKDPSLFSPIPGTPTHKVELCHAAAHEKVHTLSDLLLRRTRIGLLLPEGGKAYLDEVETLCSPFLDWDKNQWETERKGYIERWKKFYSPPAIKDKSIPEPTGHSAVKS